MKVRFLMRSLSAALLLCSLFTGCAEKEQEGALTLYYPQVTNIGPSMSFISDAPSYHGPKPSAFAITRVALDGTSIETSSFSINENSGSITLSDTEGLKVGSYAVSVSCMADGRRYDFADVFLVKMLPISPEKIEASESLLVIPFAELKTSDRTVSIILTGESVSIQSYALIQEEGKEYFKVSKDGIISVNDAFKGEFMPGIYPLSLKVVSYAGEAVYEDFVTISLTSEALSLSYPSANGKVETGLAFESGVPAVKASPEGLAYALKAVSPETDKITVDASTGVIRVAEGNGFEIGSSYVVDVTVTNEYGSVDFASVLTLTTVAFINPIDPASFSYDAAEAIQGGAFSIAPKAGLVGDEISFAFDSVPAELDGKVVISAADGTVSAAKGNTIPAGNYEIRVKVSNVKSSATAILKLNVIENPYFFSYIWYGNNIGLPNDGTYANQFRVTTLDEVKALDLVPQTDAKEGVTLEWSVTNMVSANGTIDSATGKLSMTGFKSNNLGLALVTAVAGKGTAGETSVTVPVFFSYLQLVNGKLPITYTPFVIQANPRKGVRSAAPVAFGIDNPSDFYLDYRRTFSYYNIAGPETHVTGQLAAANTGTFIYAMWKNYYTQLGKAVNAGEKNPVSYYRNSSNLAQALLYIDAADKSVVVNANKWIDSDGVCANGAFQGQITYVTNGDGSDNNVSGGSQIFPIWIWFDEKF